MLQMSKTDLPISLEKGGQTPACCHYFSFCLLSHTGAAYPAPASPDWMQLGRDQLKKALNLERNTNRAKNVILMVGDGMDATTITASRIYEGQLRGDAGEENAFAFETFPYVALSKVNIVLVQQRCQSGKFSFLGENNV